MNGDALNTFTHDDERLLDTGEAAKLLHVSSKTLAYWRSTGEGPPFVRLGVRTIRYQRASLLAYVDRRSILNTASGC